MRPLTPALSLAILLALSPVRAQENRAPIDEAAVEASPKSAVDPLSGGAPAPSRASRAPVPLPDVQAAGPSVTRCEMKEPTGNLTVVAKTKTGVRVRLDLVDPAGFAFVSGSPFEDPKARAGIWKVRAHAVGHRVDEREVRVPENETVVETIDMVPTDTSRGDGAS